MSTPLTITHNFVSGKPDSGDETLINPSNWNDVHVFNNLPEDATLYFDGTGNWSAPSGSGGSSSLFTTPIDIDVDTGTSTQGTAIRINSVSGGAGCGAGILWTDNADVLQMGLISGQDDDNWGGRLVFHTSPQTESSPGGTLTERMRIDSSGHVGINTETPTGILHVNASQHNTGVPTFIITESQYSDTIFSVQSKGRAILNAFDDYSGAGPALTITQNGSNAGSALTVIQNGNGGSGVGPALVLEQNNSDIPAMTISGGSGSTIGSASGTALTVNASEEIITGLALTKTTTGNMMTANQSYTAGPVSGSSSFTLSSSGLNAGISLTDGAGTGTSTTAGSFFLSLDGANVTGDSLTGVSTSVTNNGTGSANNFYAYNAATPTLGTFSGIAAAYEADAGWPYLLYCTDTSAQVLIGALGGGETQMVTADNNGQLGVQAIPSVPVTGLTAGSGISLSDSSGNFTVSTTTPVIQNIGASSSITIDWSQGQVAICNMNGDLNLDFFNAVPGVTYTVVMVQANGNDVNWSGNFKGASQIGSIYGSGNAHTKAIQQFICIDGSGSIYATAPATYNM